MANDLSALIPKILAQGQLALREYCVMPRLVNLSYGMEAREKGDTIDIPIPSAVAVADVAPSATPPSTADSVPTKAQIPLSYWREAAFYLTDKDYLQAMNDVIPMQASEAIRALANDVNAKIFALVTKLYGVAGLSNVIPFSGSLDNALTVRQRLNEQLAPPDNRRLVVSPSSEMKALSNTGMQDATFRGDTAGIIEGQIGRKLGFNWFSDQIMPTITTGSITVGPITVSGAHSLGATSVLLAAGAGISASIVVGDILQFAGNSGTYVAMSVANVPASGSAAVTIYPGLTGALAGGNITKMFGIDASGGFGQVGTSVTYTSNIGFHRDCFAFASRPLMDTIITPGDRQSIMTTVDPVSGIVLRLEVTRENKRTRWAYDILYGVGCVRPQYGVRLATSA